MKKSIHEINNILVRDLCKQFDEFLLDHVSFQVPRGRIVGFIGENGAGKSTTINLILDELKKDNGQIQIFGREHTSSSVKEDIGVVFDECNFHDVFNVSDIEKILSGVYKSWDSSLYRQYLKKFKIPERKQIGSFSKGMKMKFSLALALSHEAELLIMDEPTSGLDPLVRSQMLKILADYIKKSSRAVFFSTHITSDLEQIADRLILIDNGRILFQEKKDTLLETYRIVKGDNSLLNAESRKLFLSLNPMERSFIGLTDKPEEIARIMPDALMERPTIENIMLGKIERGNASWQL